MPQNTLTPVRRGSLVLAASAEEEAVLRASFEALRADDLELGQSVALKFLLAEKATRPGMLSQFRGEVRTARFAPDGESLQWLATEDQREVVLSQEPEVTPFMRLQTMLLAPFVPEQLL